MGKVISSALSGISTSVDINRKKYYRLRCLCKTPIGHCLEYGDNCQITVTGTLSAFPWISFLFLDFLFLVYQFLSCANNLHHFVKRVHLDSFITLYKTLFTHYMINSKRKTFLIKRWKDIDVKNRYYFCLIQFLFE